MALVRLSVTTVLKTNFSKTVLFVIKKGIFQGKTPTFCTLTNYYKSKGLKRLSFVK